MKQKRFYNFIINFSNLFDFFLDTKHLKIKY